MRASSGTQSARQPASMAINSRPRPMVTPQSARAAEHSSAAKTRYRNHRSQVNRYAGSLPITRPERRQIVSRNRLEPNKLRDSASPRKSIGPRSSPGRIAFWLSIRMNAGSLHDSQLHPPGRFSWSTTGLGSSTLSLTFKIDLGRIDARCGVEQSGSSSGS